MLKFVGLLVVTTVLIGELRATIPIDQALRFRPISKNGNSWVLNANKLVDGILQDFKSQIPDSMPLHEIRSSYHTKLWFIKMGGTYHLWNGKIWGLSSVHRTGDVQISYHDNTKTFEIAASLGARRLWASYEGHGEMKPISISPHIQATIPNLVVSAKICATVVNPIQLRVCGVKVSAGDPKLSFHGLHMFNGLADVLSNMFLRNTKPNMIRSAEDGLRKMLWQYLQQNKRQLGRKIQNIVNNKLA